MKTTFKNTRPVIASLAHKLQSAGYTLDTVFTGSIWINVEGKNDREQRQSLKTIVVEHKIVLIRVLNSESISRYVNVSTHRQVENFASAETVDGSLLDVIKEFREQWKGRGWPSV